MMRSKLGHPRTLGAEANVCTIPRYVGQRFGLRNAASWAQCINARTLCLSHFFVGFPSEHDSNIETATPTLQNMAIAQSDSVELRRHLEKSSTRASMHPYTFSMVCDVLTRPVRRHLRPHLHPYTWCLSARHTKPKTQRRCTRNRASSGLTGHRPPHEG